MDFEVIPVIDLRNGTVVHARRGDRTTYAPISSALCATADPLDIARALVRFASANILYVADLDVLAGAASQVALIEAIANALPHVTLWVDHGVRLKDDLKRFEHLRNVVSVIASESLQNPNGLDLQHDRHGWILSLDYRADAMIDPSGIGANAAAWPARVIGMTLSRVGSRQGPDTTRLAQIAEQVRAAGTTVDLYAAGGVRGANDLRELASLGVRGALVASTLHDGSLTRADIDAITPRARARA